MLRRGAASAQLTDSPEDQARVLRAMLDHVADGAIAFDRNGRVIAFNSAAVRISRRDLARTSLTQWVEDTGFFLPDMETPCPPDQRPATRALRGETVHGMILFVRSPILPDGIWVSVDAHPLRHARNGRGGAIIIFRDITESRRSAVALERSEQTFSALVQNVQDVISVLDESGAIRFVSPAIEAVLGYSPQELTGRRASDLTHHEDSPRFEKVLEELLKSPGGTAEEDFRWRQKDGSWRHLAIRAKNLLENPAVGGILSTLRDITTRVRSEQQALFQTALLDHLRAAVVALDPKSRIVYWNNFAWKLHQLAMEEVAGKTIMEVAVAPEDRGRYEELLKDVHKAGHCESELRMQRRDGSTFPVLSTLAAVRSRGGRLIGYVHVSIDVTEHKQSEERLKAFQGQLRELDARNQSLREAERARIARDIHDELGQELTALKMELFRIGKTLTADADIPEAVESINSALGMVDASLDSVRRIASELRPSVLDDLGLAAAIEWQLQEFHSRTGTWCSLKRPDEDFQMDPVRATEVFRIFQEVLTNVARHAAATAVKVTLKREGNDLILEVRDDGRGILPQELKGPGSLGLLGMRERALRLRGELTIRPMRGKGTRVFLRAPVETPQEDTIENPDS